MKATWRSYLKDYASKIPKISVVSHSTDDLNPTSVKGLIHVTNKQEIPFITVTNIWSSTKMRIRNMNEIVPQNIHILFFHNFFIITLIWLFLIRKTEKEKKTLKKKMPTICSFKICKLSYVCVKIVIIMDLVSPVKKNTLFYSYNGLICKLVTLFYLLGRCLDHIFLDIRVVKLKIDDSP